MDRPLVLVGARGVGKTVLLKEIADRAAATVGSPRLRVEATPGAPLLPLLVERSQALTALVEGQPSRGRLTLSETILRAGVGGLGAEVHLSARSRPSPDLPRALDRLANALAQRSSALVLTVDEAQAVSRSELALLGAALQEGTEQDWPLVVVLAGLPSLRPGAAQRGARAEHGFTYFERARWVQVGLLDEQSTLLALGGPASRAGRPFEPAAALEVAARTGGYPFAVQVYGEYAWRSSDGHATISLAAAEASLGHAQRDLEEGLYSSRWSEASPRERVYLVAVAELLTRGEQPNGGAVARHLHETTRALSSYRDRLLNKGTLFATETGVLRFTVPGMASYVLQRAAEGLFRGTQAD